MLLPLWTNDEEHREMRNRIVLDFDTNIPNQHKILGEFYRLLATDLARVDTESERERLRRNHLMFDMSHREVGVIERYLERTTMSEQKRAETNAHLEKVKQRREDSARQMLRHFPAFP